MPIQFFRRDFPEIDSNDIRAARSRDAGRLLHTAFQIGVFAFLALSVAFSVFAAGDEFYGTTIRIAATGAN